jgi:hypothetical protein
LYLIISTSVQEGIELFTVQACKRTFGLARQARRIGTAISLPAMFMFWKCCLPMEFELAHRLPYLTWSHTKDMKQWSIFSRYCSLVLSWIMLHLWVYFCNRFPNTIAQKEKAISKVPTESGDRTHLSVNKKCCKVVHTQPCTILRINGTNHPVMFNQKHQYKRVKARQWKGTHHILYIKGCWEGGGRQAYGAPTVYTAIMTNVCNKIIYGEKLFD